MFYKLLILAAIAAATAAICLPAVSTITRAGLAMLIASLAAEATALKIQKQKERNRRHG